MTRRLHLLGIGGSGMSGIAAVLAERGVDVSGCDRDSGGHDPGHLEPGMEVGYSGAVPGDEPELVEAAGSGSSSTTGPTCSPRSSRPARGSPWRARTARRRRAA